MRETSDLQKAAPGVEAVEASVAKDNLSTQASEHQSIGIPEDSSEMPASAGKYLPKVDISDSGSAEHNNLWNNQLKNAEIILIRHGDKSQDPADPNLSEKGYARASKLPGFFQKEFGKNPDDLFASADSAQSRRPGETLEPTAKISAEQIGKSIPAKRYRELANELDSSKFDGKSIAIAWHHGDIPQLAQALGAPPGSYPQAWKANDFDHAVDIHYDSNGTASARLISEGLNGTGSKGTGGT